MKKISSLFLALLLSCTMLLPGCTPEPSVETPSIPSVEASAPSVEQAPGIPTRPELPPAPELSVPDTDEPADVPPDSDSQLVEPCLDMAFIRASVGEIPAVSLFREDQPWVTVNGNEPFFSQEERAITAAFELFSDLDALGRCGVTFANVCPDLMPTEPRGEIGQVKPTGWHTVKYDCVDGKYLYNRAHLLGFQLTGENANRQNLITGTRFFNVEGMLPFENMVADYVKETGNHVLYRVTPLFEGDNLLANGVLMEAYSVEDEGAGICFCVFVYNCQPGVTIDYATGVSHLTEADTDDKEEDKAPVVVPAPEPEPEPEPVGTDYVLNKSTKKFHYPDCRSVGQMSEKNKLYFTGTRAEVLSRGYDPCGHCDP